jgi:hypothetical protein
VSEALTPTEFRLLAALAGRPQTVDELVAVIYAAVPREVWPAAELSVRAQLEYLGVL